MDALITNSDAAAIPPGIKGGTEFSTVYYTSIAEMESLLSFLGVQLRLDDNDDDLIISPETVYLSDAMAEATDVVNQYIGLIYDEEELAYSRWVRRRASWIACHILSRRRGNPKQFADEYMRCIADFELVRRREIWVPRRKPKHDFAPAMSNLRVDYRRRNYYQGSPIRVDPISSTGQGGPSPFKDWTYWGEW
jgi:hypothetical protein